MRNSHPQVRDQGEEETEVTLRAIEGEAVEMLEVLVMLL